MLLLAAVLASLFAANDTVVLSNACGRAEVSLVGAQVLSYVPAGGEELLFFPDDRDFSHNREMHGGIPVCWPWFGRLGEPGSRMHGLARYARWEVASVSNGLNRSCAVLTLTSCAATRAVWPHDFALCYTISLGVELELKLETANTGKDSFAATMGFHPYFRVKNPAKVCVTGLARPVAVHPGIDEGFYTPSNGVYRFDSGFAPREIVAQGECRLIVWNPGPDWPDWRLGCNLDPQDDWRHFVCIEPTITRRDHAVVVLPDCHHVFAMKIR